MGLTVNRETTKLLNLDAERSSLTFLGYEFRKVRDRLFGTGKRYLHYGLYRLAWADVRRAR